MVNLPSEKRRLLDVERDNFNMRLNSLKSWAVLHLEEIHIYSHQVFDVLDDWVVIAVKSENSACQDVLKEIKQEITDGSSYLEPKILREDNLFD